jgi:hypothetical protein
MSDENPTITESRKVFIRRAGSSRFLASGSHSAVTPEDNLVLRQLQGLRKENQVFLEREVEDRQRLIRLAERMEAGFDNIRSDIRQLRQEVKEPRGDLMLTENKLINGQNDILAVLRRLDEIESVPFEVYEEEALTEAETGIPMPQG